MKKQLIGILFLFTLVVAPTLAQTACYGSYYGHFSIWFFSNEETNKFLAQYPNASLPLGTSIVVGQSSEVAPYSWIGNTAIQASRDLVKTNYYTLLEGMGGQGSCSLAQWLANYSSCLTQTETYMANLVNAGADAIYMNEPWYAPGCTGGINDCTTAWYVGMYSSLNSFYHSMKKDVFFYPTLGDANPTGQVAAFLAANPQMQVDGFSLEQYNSSHLASDLCSWKTTYPGKKCQLLLYHSKALCKAGIDPSVDTYAFWDVDNYAGWGGGTDVDWQKNVMQFVTTSQMAFCANPFSYDLNTYAWFYAGNNAVTAYDVIYSPTNSPITKCEYKVVDGIDMMGNGGTVTRDWTARSCPPVNGYNSTFTVTAGPGMDCPTLYSNVSPVSCGVYIRAWNAAGVLGDTTLNRHPVKF